MSKQVTPPPRGDKPTPSAPPPPPAWRHWLWPIAIVIVLALWFVLPAVRRSFRTRKQPYFQLCHVVLWSMFLMLA